VVALVFPGADYLKSKQTLTAAMKILGFKATVKK